MYDFLNQQIYMADAMALDRLVNEAARPGMQVIELGTFTGRSSLAMLPTIQRHGGRLMCVDWFKGNEGLQEGVGLTHAYARDNVLEAFRHNLREGGFEASVNVVVGKTQEVAPSVADGFADLVFVDADHRYTGVRQDIVDWYPKLKEGGILCGHDFELPMSRCDEAEVLKHCETDFVDGRHYGVIRAVSEFFPDACQQGVVWWVVKKAGAYPELEAAVAARQAEIARPVLGPEPTSHPVLDHFLETYAVESLLAEGRIVWRAGDAVNAMRAAKALNRRFPSFAPGWVLAYEILLTLGEEAEAERHLHLGLQAVGTSPELLALVGGHRHRQGQAEAAAEAFQASLLPQLNGILNLGFVQLAAGQSEAAKVCFQMALQLNPAEVDALQGLAEAHFNLGEHAAAASLAGQLSLLTPEAPALAELKAHLAAHGVPA